ncbi:hypothetical protein ABZ787_13270 [Micrococcus luteus]|uniref:Uncharacterized protein n=1 Tax=Niallia taxi TaxID=2499688 RepID=A0A437K319_9BACI|nr:hypothetical protein [Niallia taxi]MDK8643919.1 hypothetical protein [Niallia taxi]MED4057798.1 hypothetical protein [Niallia taxi]RVT56366.1 hypothetical protein EM808_27665 [Niallia taxi]
MREGIYEVKHRIKRIVSKGVRDITKPLILKNKTYNQIKKMVSPIYKGIIPNSNEIVTGLIFPEEIILLSDVRRALKRINQDSEIKRIAVGYCFTIEAQQLLKEYNYNTFSISNFEWSDERYKEIKGGSS